MKNIFYIIVLGSFFMQFCDSKKNDYQKSMISSITQINNTKKRLDINAQEIKKLNYFDFYLKDDISLIFSSTDDSLIFYKSDLIKKVLNLNKDDSLKIINQRGSEVAIFNIKDSYFKKSRKSNIYYLVLDFKPNIKSILLILDKNGKVLSEALGFWNKEQELFECIYYSGSIEELIHTPLFIKVVV